MGTVREIRSLLFGRLAHEGALAVITSYFDDSGTHAESPVTLYGGLVGNEEQWLKFETEWAAQLQQPTKGKPPIKRFHAFNCEWGLGEFEGYSRPDSDSTFYNFRKVT